MNMPTRQSKPLPRFRSEAQERKFWEGKTNDATEFFDPARLFGGTFENLKPSTARLTSPEPRLP